MDTDIREMACPQCGAQVPVEDGLRNWCEDCGWNVSGELPPPDEGFFLRQYARLGDRYGRGMLEKLKVAGTSNLRPRWTVQRFLGLALAACVHLLSLVLLLLGVLLIAVGFPDPLPIIAGVIACAFAWVVRPRPQSFPTKDVLARDEFPALYGLVDDVVQELGGKPVGHIVVNEHFNASYGEAGWARTPVLTIGLPLWLSLAPQERIAILGHEIAHGVNADVTRSFVVCSALNALDVWTGALCTPVYEGRSIIEIVMSRLFFLPFAAWQRLTAQLLWLDKQQAEYFADHLGASVAGTEAAASTLQRLGCGEHLQDVLLRHAYSSSQSGAHILALYLQRISNLPEREWRRLARSAQLERARLDASHPPTACRVEFLNAHPIEPRIIAVESVMNAVNAELDTLRERIGGRLIAQYARD